MRIFYRGFWLVILLAFVLGACQEKEEPCKCTNIDTSFNFSIVNDANMDLLNPSNPEHIDIRDVAVSFLLDGERVDVYDSRINHLRSFPKIIEPESLADADSYVLNVILNSSEEEALPTTYLEWNNGSVDTLEAEFSFSSNSSIVNRLWLNGDLIWDMQRDGARPIYSLIKTNGE
ncbi:hypothetical protein LZF95_12290 [Algoriphagus sp. AGSA1]|uniref:hypothetical protein n=1 Tax=Algoriphagus sp. AGSA1 TaxID=2907213 RepID=UPI001F3403A0|nr:hypothetical protein [Algoriphagus sp. AGSA1]MCE7055457.1 hypothetical protein [Algoriphagus sp. AGSA1]